MSRPPLAPDKPASPSLPLRPRELGPAREFVESWLERVIPAHGWPPTRLHLAMREAVFPGGKRTRPTLVMLVAESYGGVNAESDQAEMAGRMATAVELVHCASLVHDDLPAFDDAQMRRGLPSCQAEFGEPTAILVGDALLTLAFETLVSAPLEKAVTAMQMARLLADGTGSRRGIIGGQGLELQTNVDLDAYHSLKTSSLFRAAAAGGALAAGHEDDVPRWSRFGELLGRILQMRDDLDDCFASQSEIGKPVRRDAQLGRPNAVHSTSETEARQLLSSMIREVTAILGEPGVHNATLRSLVSLVSGIRGPRPQ